VSRNPFAEYAAGCVAVFKRDLRITLSYRARLVTHLVSAFFTVTLFHFISRLVSVSRFPTHNAYFAYVLVGLVALQVLNSTLALPPSAVRQELVAGTFERLLVSPLGAVAGVVSTLFFPFVYAFATALAIVAFAVVAFGVSVHWTTLPLLAPLAILGASSFAPFGITLLSIGLLAKQAVSGANFVVAGISLVAGLYFPISLLPAWIRWMGDVQPFSPAIDMIRHVVVGSHLTQALWLELVKVVGFAVVLLPVSIAGLIAALRFSRRQGTALEY
jgi:ABC-2 type transport system permease protein